MRCKPWILFFVLVTFASSVWAQTPTHVFLFDVSGSMRVPMQVQSNRDFISQALVGNPKVVLGGERIIARGFNLSKQAPTFEARDPLRYWPRGELSSIANAEQLREAAQSILGSIRVTGEDTNLPQALTLGFLDHQNLAGGGPAFVWMLTDNWQDVGKGSTAGMDEFYQTLAQDPRIRSVKLVPMLHSETEMKENLVLYAILLASEDDEALAADFVRRVAAVAEKGAGFAFLEGSMVPIACRGMVLSTPRIAHSPAPQFQSEGECQGVLEAEGNRLDFYDLELGVPLTGRVSFNFQSTMKEWRIQGVRIEDAIFSFNSSSHEGFLLPPNARANITPPVISDLRPGQKSTTRFQMVFPASGLFTPTLDSRGFRQFFPGDEIYVEGSARLSVHIDLEERNLVLNDETLAELIGRIRLIEEIEQMMSAGSEGARQVRLSKTYPASFRIKVNDGATKAGLIILLILIAAVAAAAWLLLRPSGVLCRVNEGEERSLKLSYLQPVRVQTEGSYLGILKRNLLGSVRFFPVPSTDPDVLNHVTPVGREATDAEVFVDDDLHKISLRLI